MREPKVQPLVAFILRGAQILLLLRIRHSLQLLLAISVPPHIVRLDRYDEDDVIRQDPQQDLVAPVVKRYIVRLVGVRRDNRRRLDAHIVDGRPDGAGAHATRVARRDGDDDGVDVGKP